MTPRFGRLEIGLARSYTRDLLDDSSWRRCATALPLFDVKNRRAELVVCVEDGEVIVITRRGKPVAR